jgi:Spinocerebellar ataxia type 10 protein domain
LAAFGADQYKKVLVGNGCLVFSCDLIGAVKVKCDKLEQSGEWDVKDARENPLKERVHPLSGIKILITNLIGSLTYESSPLVDNYF